MKYEFEVLAILTVDPSAEKHNLQAKFALEVSDNLDESKYIDQITKQPTVDGSKAITQTLIAALGGNIHFAHQTGKRDSAEHLRHIIAELEKLFIMHNSEVGVEEWDKGKLVEKRKV
jgi:hypothetical protein